MIRGLTSNRLWRLVFSHFWIKLHLSLLKCLCLDWTPRVCLPLSRLAFGLLLRWQVGLAGARHGWLQFLVGAEGQFWWCPNTQNGIVGKAKGWESSRGSEYNRLRCGGADGVLWLAAVSRRWRLPPQLRPAVAGEMSHGGAWERSLLNARERSLFLLTSRKGSLHRRTPGAYALKQALPLPASLRANSLFSPDVSVLAFRLFLFHVAITYVCSRGSLSTHFINGKEHM